MPDYRLNPAQARVLGSLIEKEIATPDYYPLSLNALANACNQRSNREPVMTLDEDDLRLALRHLEEQNLAGRARSSDGRVTKFEHWLGEAFNLTRAETALLCVLMLRGAQTPGELRGRTERLYEFAEVADVTAGLEKLMERTPPLAAVLARQPGAREARYVHLLSGEVEETPGLAVSTFSTPAQAAVRTETTSAGEPSAHRSEENERIAQLEAEVRELREQLNELAARIDGLFGD